MRYYDDWLDYCLATVGSSGSAIGARIRIKAKLPDGSFQNFYHTVNTGGSFGSNPLMISAGLGNAVAIEEIEINWPNAKHSTEIIKNIQMGTVLKIKEGMGVQ